MNTKFTPEFIRQQKELGKAATERPYSFFNAYNLVSKAGVVASTRLGTEEETVIQASPYGYDEIHVKEADARYVAAACNNYPDALAEIERLRGLLDGMWCGICDRLMLEHQKPCELKP
jgi:hypothetical protein